MTYTFKDVLNLEISPVLGCTEPVAVALAAASAASLLQDQQISEIRVLVSPGVFKNGIGVYLPGTGGLRGLDLAAALGALGGDPAQRMQVLAFLENHVVQRAREFIAAGKVSLDIDLQHSGLRVQVQLQSVTHSARAVIQGQHDHLVELCLDNTPVDLERVLDPGAATNQKELPRLESWLSAQELPALIELSQELAQEELDYLYTGVEYNMALAEYGLQKSPGLAVGAGLQTLVHQGLLQEDLQLQAQILTAAAADARMSGAELPAMSSAGSGNNGLTAILAIWAARDYLNVPRERILSGIALSHLLTITVKTRIGRLAPLCTCSIAAGAGAAAGLAKVMQSDQDRILAAVLNLLQDLTGVICDGAKPGCALKLATAAGSAVKSALLATHGVSIPPQEGLSAATLHGAIDNLAELCARGMQDMEHTVLDILQTKQ